MLQDPVVASLQGITKQDHHFRNKVLDERVCPYLVALFKHLVVDQTEQLGQDLGHRKRKRAALKLTLVKRVKPPQEDGSCGLLQAKRKSQHSKLEVKGPILPKPLPRNGNEGQGIGFR